MILIWRRDRWTTCRQNHIAFIPPKEGPELSRMDKNNKCSRDERNNRHQEAQARKKPPRDKQVVNANPHQPNYDGDDHYFVLVFDHERPKGKVSVSLVKRASPAISNALLRIWSSTSSAR